MDKINLFIIEDDPSLRQNYERSIKLFNSKNDINFIHTIIDNLTNGLATAQEVYFDAAIIDLKLSSTDEVGSGNQIIEKILELKRYPIFIVTARPDMLDDSFEEYSGTCFFQIFERTSKKVYDILKLIVKIHKTGITKLLSKKGLIDEHLDAIFWKHISKSMNYWINEVENTEDINEILTRYVCLYLLEYLGIDKVGDLEKYHPAEVYHYPPISDRPCTGDIISKNNTNFIIISPACDVVVQEDGKRNADHFILCRLIDIKEDQYIKNYIDNASNTTKKNANRIIKNKKGRYHFLPPYDNIEGYLIDFEQLQFVNVDDIESYTRFATVSAPFIKNIRTRLFSFLSREGQPDFNNDLICSKIKAMADDTK